MSRPASPHDSDEGTPRGFRIHRELPLGRHPILAAFPGLDRLDAARRLVPKPGPRAELFRSTYIELVPQDMWMYVSPFELPKGVRREWRPIVSPGADCIVIGEAHLRSSSALMLFLDIYHELCHVVQRQGGADLWPPGVSYVRRWTEVEAYRFVVNEAKKLGVSNAYLAEYLRVEWISEAEHRELVVELGLSER